jgi:hypothetical protein
MRRKESARQSLRVSSDAERMLQASWWAEHRAEDKRWLRAHPARDHKTRQVFSSGESRNALFSDASQGMPWNHWANRMNCKVVREIQNPYAENMSRLWECSTRRNR